MTFRSGHDLDDSGITDFAEHAAQQGNGTQEDTAVDKALMGSGRAHHNHLCEPGSESSMRRWLQVCIHGALRGGHCFDMATTHVGAGSSTAVRSRARGEPQILVSRHALT